MLRWSLAFLVISMIAVLFGFSGFAPEVTAVARAICLVAMILFLGCLARGPVKLD